jgi:hypothetical protein
MNKNQELKDWAEIRSSIPELIPYINNLDKLLGIKTINSCHQLFGVQFCERHEHTACHNCNINCDNVKELTLKKKELAINDKNYDWFITDKEKNKDQFCITGINKKRDIVVKYLLGKDINNKTILKKLIQGE